MLFLSLIIFEFVFSEDVFTKFFWWYFYANTLFLHDERIIPTFEHLLKSQKY